MVVLSEASQRKDKQLRYQLYAESKKVIQMNLLIKQKQTHKHRKQTCQRGKVGRGINQEAGISIYIPLYTKLVISKDLLYGTGNSTQ